MKFCITHTRASARAAIAALTMSVAACAPSLTATRSTAPSQTETRAYDTKAGRFIDVRALVSAMNDADVVFFGEQHDDPATHRAELAYLASVGAAKDNVVVSLEMFERDVQHVLDSYLTGQVNDSVFKATSRPWPNYVNDYRPLVELARANGWPVLASNVPRRIASAVSRGTLKALDSLASGDRAFAARDISCPRDKYYERFASEMSGHSAGGVATAPDSTATAMTNRFYEAQCVKDETMAESIVAAMDRAGRGATVMHFNGAFHSNMGLGTAARVKRRRPAARIVVVSAVPVEKAWNAEASEFAELADYILLTPKPPGR